MNGHRNIWIAVVLAPALLAAAFYLQRRAARALPNVANGGPAAPTLRMARTMFLGYNGLAADIYWTEAIQYFGSRHLARSRTYPRLAPLLNLSYRLDPDLLPAAEYGAFFLADRPPFAAGEPQAAVALLRRAIHRHPQSWRLYYDLGFVYALNLHQPRQAAQAFLAGSKVHPTNPAMAVLAADYFSQSNQARLAAALWSEMYQHAPNADLRANALDHLQAIRAHADIRALEDLAAAYRRRYGHGPASWNALIAIGALRRPPLDPQGHAYVLKPGGRVTLDPATHIYSFNRTQ
ncbi:MAG: tetratricopeptide repeat protein [Terriglobales bacterium]